MENGNKSISKVYVILGVIICLCAIAEFIIWIVDASKAHLANEVVLGTGLLSVTGGVLIYLLTRRSSYTVANTVLWVTIIASIVLFIIGLSITPAVSVMGVVNP